jgi:HEAT repeat protein
VIQGLCGLLRDDTPEVQIAAAEALGQFGAEAVDAGAHLLRTLQTSKPTVRQRIMRAMALIRPAEAMSAFLAGLQDPDAEVRKLASAGLVLTSAVSDEFVEPVIDALHDPEPRVRANVALALARQGQLPEKVIPVLVECTADSNDGVRLNAARALQSLSPEALEPEVDRLLADPNRGIRLQTARFVLAQNPSDPRALRVIEEAFTSSTEAVVDEVA